MSKELPYFKFYVNEWITGDITLEDYTVQGLFINICAYYWSKECKCTLTMLSKKFKCMDNEIQILISTKIMKVDSHDNIVINFLNEQKDEWKLLSKTNSKNGKKGGRPKSEIKPNEKPSESEIKPTALFSVKRNESETKAKKSNIEEIRREDSIVDDISANNRSFIDNNYINQNTFEISSNETNGIKLLDDANGKQRDAIFLKLGKNDAKLFQYVVNYFNNHRNANGKPSDTFTEYCTHLNNWLNKIGQTGIDDLKKEFLKLSIPKQTTNSYVDKYRD